MRELVFLLEERSAQTMIEGFLPKITGSDAIVRYIIFEGKQDLAKQLTRKLRSYNNPNANFIILYDQDSADCRDVKSMLKQKCVEADKPQTVVRMACRELESWYLADLMAVEKAFSKTSLSAQQNKRKFRNPDLLASPSNELKRLVPEYQKINGSRMIAPYLNLNNIRSRSFHHFIRSITNIISCS